MDPTSPAVVSASTSKPIAPLASVSDGTQTLQPNEDIDVAQSSADRFVTPDPPTTAMANILPRQRGFSPPPAYSVPEWIPNDTYNPAMEPGTPPLSKTSFFPFETDYTATLPHLPPFPPGHQSAKRRKTSKDDKRKDMVQLRYEYALNPLSGALSKSTKCLSTEDWKVAMAEIRHIRAMERIDQKKEGGRWSLRQPKKLRGPPIPKAHWDYLLEEMVRLGFFESPDTTIDPRNGSVWTLPRSAGGKWASPGNSPFNALNGILLRRKRKQA